MKKSGKDLSGYRTFTRKIGPVTGRWQPSEARTLWLQSKWLLLLPKLEKHYRKASGGYRLASPLHHARGRFTVEISHNHHPAHGMLSLSHMVVPARTLLYGDVDPFIEAYKELLNMEAAQLSQEPES